MFSPPLNPNLIFLTAILHYKASLNPEKETRGLKSACFAEKYVL
jgi:hypothetical protein